MGWLDYSNSIGQLGSARDDVHWGMLCALLYECHRAKGAHKQPTDFMPYHQEEIQEQTPEQQRAALRRILGRPPLDKDNKG